ncbi:methyltransferase [Reyranella sp. CPCC 100927]|uniref:methyltransferase n=1 Tax=Reyranella sp. CPCC 100927 TaxID=2599616 RepID=UPI0011B7C16F|nr:methyltransferase [Reyranella sp. CPCC 100927]TWT01658.1 methyltransferase [Reyranella sp. CPCC 100927]
MTPQELPPPIILFRMVTGYYVSRAVHLAAELGIADLLGQGPLHYEALASRTATHPSSLNRVLRLLAGAGVLSEEDGGRFALTPVGACLRRDVPGSMHAAALLFGGNTQQAWGELLHSVRTGEPAYRRVFGADAFTHLEQHPNDARTFDLAMAGFTRMIAGAVAASYDFSPFATVMDVGGGNGMLLEGVLTAHPTLRGIVFDLPHVVEHARARLVETSLADRCTAAAGDFFADVPAGADAYMLKHVIHDWNDKRATAILKNCHRAMTPDGKLLLVEGVYPPRIDGSDTAFSAAANDVNMLVCTGGRQRSEQAFRDLYNAAGFRLTRIVPTPARVCVIEGVKA